jgi:putative membrane protein
MNDFFDQYRRVMNTNEEKNKSDNRKSSSNLTDHLANERTFLSWIRTSIAIMAFGFVVVKFSLFVKQLSIVFEKPLPVNSHGYSSAIGIFLVAFGMAMALFSFLQFKRIEKQLFESTYSPSSKLSSILIASIVVIGTVLVCYLLYSI